MLPAPLKSVLRWHRRVWKGLDRLVNALFGGSDEETISYRAAKRAAEGGRFGCLVCRLLDLVQRDHCRIALDTDNKGATLMAPAPDDTAA